MERAKKIITSLFIGLVISFLNMNGLAFATTQDFYFEDYVADYYLSPAEDGSSKLHVKEVLTAFFPEFDQNHGITKTIPFLNQAGKNRTVKSEAALNFSALRNGVPENIAKTTKDDTTFTFYLGEPDKFVHGAQVYTLEYDFTNVIVDFDENENNVSSDPKAIKAFQELFWDTNGTGWEQEFKKVTANLHIDSASIQKLKPEVWCYVGKYTEKGQERCNFLKTDDGFTFATENLLPGENLSFVVRFEPNTFYVSIKKEYILVWLFIGEIVLCIIALFFKIRKWYKIAKPKYDLYKNIFVSPQYLPPEDQRIHVAEAEQLCLKKVKKSYVATLLELVVSKKATVFKATEEKHFKKKTWTVRLDVASEELSVPQCKMLEILNGSSGLKQGLEILIKKHRPTLWLSNCAKDYVSKAKNTLVQHGYMIKESPLHKSGATSSGGWLVMIVLIVQFGLIAAIKPLGNFVDNLDTLYVVGKEYLPICMVVLLVLVIIAGKIIKRRTQKYSLYTDRGIETVRYLEGLEMYIKMAEKDRLKFLQSVDGADTTNEGIVKLYEKLLPWASLFGAEDSWLKELSKYYEIGEIDIDKNFIDGLSSGAITNNVMQSIRSSTDYHSPVSFGSGSGWSSSDSGGGGSSFSSGGGSSGGSGGGGGGGGGGGW